MTSKNKQIKMMQIDIDIAFNYSNVFQISALEYLRLVYYKSLFFKSL
jgi:hypothetical protein